MERWSEEEEQLLKRQYPERGTEIAEQLGRTKKSITNKAQQLGVNHNNYPTHLEPEEAERKTLYLRALNMNLREIAERIGYSHGRVHKILKKHDIDTEPGREIRRNGKVKLDMDSDEASNNDLTRSLIGAADFTWRSNGTVEIELDKEDFVRICNTLGDGELPLFCRPVTERKPSGWRKPYG